MDVRELQEQVQATLCPGSFQVTLREGEGPPGRARCPKCGRIVLCYIEDDGRRRLCSHTA